ncbi:hypothetical protein EV401DRAFT_2061139 [Pisolithus croceorrhizus]|nr:hypothetical protein EV401DRAFT_2061139 [Pisolithus croceorrhizus]
MSLPPASKDISEHPQSGAVTVPVDRRAQEADVDRKLRFYGVIQAFREGRMPDNRQIDKTLKYVYENSPVDVDQLSPDGKKLIQDTRDIIETARVIVKEKNGDELFQKFVWHTRDVSLETTKMQPGDVPQADKEKIAEDRKQAVRHLRTILSLILTNSEVRKLLSDFSVIGRDLLAKGAGKAAEAFARGGQRVGPGEVPVLDAKIPGTDITVEQHPHADEPKIITEEGEQKPGSQAYQEGMEEARRRYGNAAGQAGGLKEQAYQSAQQKAQRAREGGDVEGARAETSEEAEEKKQGFLERVWGVRDNIAERIPQQHKDKAQEHFERGRKFLAEEYFPEERRDQFIYRGKKVIIECQKHDDYQDAFKWLLSVTEDYANRGLAIAGRGKESGQAFISDPALSQATSELRELLERFANGKSMNIIFDAVDALVDDARRDEEFRNWFKRLNNYIHRVLLETGYVLDESCNAEGVEIRESGRKYWDVKYRTHFDNLFNAIGKWFSAMAEDPLNKRFGEDWARLTKDLLFDSEGSLKFKPELWSDIRKVIVPALVDKVGYIPIPRVEYTDDTIDLVVENLTLQGRNLFPNIVTLDAHNFMKFSPYDTISDEQHHEFVFKFAQMQADMRDVAIYYRKKTDSGIADVLLGGSGLTATVHLVSADKDKSSVFKVKSVQVKVDTLKFSIRDSKHDLLVQDLEARQIQKAIAGGIQTGFEYLDGQLVAVRERMKEAKESSDTSRTQGSPRCEHDIDAFCLFKRKKEESVRTTESKSQFKVVHTKRESYHWSRTLPAGWMNRVIDREEKATAWQ